MKIAILGWGSLIWQPKTLAFDKKEGWNKNGPFLPIEFSRISNDDRLTLVIDKDAEPIKTFYAVSLYEELDEAVLDLARREGSGRKSIGFYNRIEEKFSPNEFDFKEEVKEWIKFTDCDAVIWTNLGNGNKFKEKFKSIKEDKINNKIINYLDNLPGPIRACAEEYIRKTPKEIQTPIRSAIEKKLGWTSIEPIN